ncbi:MAG: transcription-repair coupling factor [Bacillota bacterium]|nr:transcription-repair coupling factor [Bacillota bacterium]
MFNDILGLWRDLELFNEIITKLTNNNKTRLSVSGLDGSARAFFMAALVLNNEKPAIVITADNARAEKMYADLSVFLPGKVRSLPSRELFISSEVISRSEEYSAMRMGFYEWLGNRGSGVYVTTNQALLTRVIPPEIWYSLAIEVKPGSTLNRENLIAQLVDLGYERVTLAEKGGQFSVRGDIIDIYPTGRNHPHRLALYDNLVESIRNYDPLTQRSTKNVDQLLILPASELIISGDLKETGEKEIRLKLDKAAANLRRRGDHESASFLNQQVESHLERLMQPDGLDMLSIYFPYFYGNGSSLLDYIDSDYLVLVEEPGILFEKGNTLRNEINDHSVNKIIELLELAAGRDFILKENELYTNISCPLVSFSLFPEGKNLLQTSEDYCIESKSIPYYHGQWQLFNSDYQTFKKEGFKVIICATSEQESKGLKSYLTEPLPIRVANLDEGFLISSIKLAVISTQHLLPRHKKKRKPADYGGIRLSNYRELEPGDYVVHEQHGIGKYQGIKTLEISGVKRDYLHLKYRGTDKLFIPVEQVQLIQKYSGGDAPPPRLHSLGGSEWQRLKSRVHRSVEELAGELLALYAAREATEGYQYGPDHPWQQDFESYFPYDETQDQMRAIQEVKLDLEKSHPMDRLICGDVGYGKTEVAMRAAFKVIMEGKQVAVLVPTTVLAQQHYRTFRERFNGFPVKIAQLSRFVRTGKQKEVISELATGKIDLVIGTHRLLSKDVVFRDLGLLVIDEEQRFGVKQKEKLKQMRLEVDTLSLTATPIPRTLHLSLAGARDLSIIDTPPEDRYPIQTYVLEYSENLVREAVQRELNRAGQVFIVFNRVDRINAYAERVIKLFPDAAVAVGHGQMPEAMLEKVMADFQEGLFEILVSTTIIESGLDIPNVNTLIVYEADKFGLAQLYQIRGRVGRSNRLAYAYLTFRKDKIISEAARKRLRAIKEFTELGSGFKIALRDLEIRGAGNILGAEQHGFIAAVGFDLYVKLLEQAVAELKNIKQVDRVDTRIDIPVSAYIPTSYITAQDQKVDLYQRLYRIGSIDTLHDIQEELADRYGLPPEPVKELLKVTELRILAMDLSVELIRQRKYIEVHFNRQVNPNDSLIAKAIKRNKAWLDVRSTNPLILRIENIEMIDELLNKLIILFREMLTVGKADQGGYRKG